MTKHWLTLGNISGVSKWTVLSLLIQILYEQPSGESLKSISKERSLRADRPPCETQIPSLDEKDVQGACNTLIETLLDESTIGTKRMHTAKSGNPLISVVHQSGVFDMEILYCICANAADGHEQLIHSGLFPSSYKQIETTFTFSVLDDFLTDNLECKTTAQQYYSKLQSMTKPMFPGSVPVCADSFPSQCCMSYVLISPFRIYTNDYSGHHASCVTYLLIVGPQTTQWGRAQIAMTT